MHSSDTNNFYLDLPIQDIPLRTLLTDATAFRDIPDDWYIIITDIKGSTQAVQAGLQNEVNLIATGSIIAALNIARDAHTDIPFFFGGDGATLLVPSALVKPIFEALQLHRRNVYRNFKLDLRVASLAVKDVYEAGHSIRITRVKKTAISAMPIILGNGLKYADKLIKSWDYSQYQEDISNSTLNLSGMECRWDTIPPPRNLPEVVCLLIDVEEEDQQATVYAQVLDQIERIYGSPQKRQPISLPRMRLKTSILKLATEIQVKFGERKWSTIFQTWLVTLFGQLYLRFDPVGKKYLSQIIDLSDTLTIDGRIATVISGTPQQRERLMAVLDQMETEERIYYGIYLSPESIMSCYVRNRLDQHVHFVDGTEGGYTFAAQMLKRKMKVH